MIYHCGKVGMRCHFHPEHPWKIFNNRDAEFAFLPIIDMFLNETGATIIWEHGTDARCVPFWEEMSKSGRFFVTLTAHHLVANEDNEFGDVRSVCKPSIKTKEDQIGLVDLVKKNYEWVMAGADDAPHDKNAKHPETGCCACGAYTAPFLLQLYAHALSSLLINFEGKNIFSKFICENGRNLYGFNKSSHNITITDNPFKIPLSYQAGSWTVEPFWAGRTIGWSLG